MRRLLTGVILPTTPEPNLPLPGGPAHGRTVRGAAPVAEFRPAVRAAVSSLLIGLAVLSILPAGCGGGGSDGSPSAGRVAAGAIGVTVRFPVSAEAVQAQNLPAATNSVRFTVLDQAGGQAVVPAVLVRRSGTAPAKALIGDIPPGSVLVRAEAFTHSDGSGAVIARAEAAATVTAGQTTTLRMVAGRLPVRAELTGPALLERALGAAYVATALDADGAIVLGAEFSDWASANTAVFTVDANGYLTARGRGTAELSVIAHYAQQSWTARLAVQVSERAPASVTVLPASLSLTVGERAPVQAQVLDAQGTVIEYATVAWAVADPAVVALSAPVSPPPAPTDEAGSTSGGISAMIATALAAGATRVTATGHTGAGEAVGGCDVTVAAPD